MKLAEAIDEGFLNKHTIFRTLYVINGIVYTTMDTEKQEGLIPIVNKVCTEDIADKGNILPILVEMDEVLRRQGVSLIERRGFIRSAVTLITGLLVVDDYPETIHLFIMKHPQLDIQDETLVIVRFVEELPEIEKDLYYIEIGNFYENGLDARKPLPYSWMVELTTEFLNLSYYSNIMKDGNYDTKKNRIVCEPTTKVIVRLLKDHCFSENKAEPFDANSFRHQVIAAQFSSQTEKI